MPTVLLIGGGGREHALARAFLESETRPRVLCAPGNPGTPERLDISVDDIDGLVEAAQKHEVTLVVVGPEAPLVAGLADRLRAVNIPVVGPNAAAAQLEGSKAFSKSVMDEAGVPTARWGHFDTVEPAIAFARQLGRVVVKADGLAGGKGVVVAEDLAEAEAAITDTLSGACGDAGRTVLVEERLEGEELSVIALCDGKTVCVLAPSQDHKRVGDGDSGPNTGGMGAYSPAPRGTPQLLEELKRTCLSPIVEVMAKRGAAFSGILYAGLMLTEAGPKVLEYNVRFGDPEAQVILPRLDEDAYLLFESVAKGTLPDRPVRFLDSAAVSVVLAAPGYPRAPETGHEITGLDAAAAIDGVRIYHAGTREQDGHIKSAGGRVLTVTGLGADLESAARTAYAGCREISWPGMHYRKDIAYRALGQAIGEEH